MLVVRRIVVGWAWIVGMGCVASEPIDDAGTSNGTDTGSGAGSSGQSETGGPAASCPDNPGSCPSFECIPGGCGGPLSDYDADGCVRPRCDSTQSCDVGRTCVRLGDYGSCGASSWSCEESEGECSCGGTADCNDDVSICIPDALLPELHDLVPTLEEFTEMCAAATSEDACNAAPSFYDMTDDRSMWCRWRTWVPVALGAGDVCEFGEPVQECGIATASEVGCGEDFTSCDAGGPALARSTDGQLEVSVASACGDADAYCTFSASGELAMGDPACICLCDEAFPP